MPTPNPWLTTEEPCAQLAISRSTLRSHLLWHRQRCAALLAGTRSRCGAMAESSPAQGTETAAEYLLLHRDTGTALYATRATEAEIHRANGQLRRSGNRHRYVAARHLPHGRGEGMG